MKFLNINLIVALCLSMIFVGCENKEATGPEDSAQNFEVSTSAAEEFSASFWDQNPDPTEEELEQYYNELSGLLADRKIPEDLDLTVLYDKDTDTKVARKGFVLGAIASSVISWGVGKGLDEIFTPSGSGIGSTNKAATLETAIREMNAQLSSDYTRIIAILNDLRNNPQKTQMLDGKSSKDEGIAAMLKGNYNFARSRFASALSKFRTAKPFGYSQYVSTLGLLNECNRRLAKNSNQFMTNMNRVAIEANLCDATFDFGPAGIQGFKSIDQRLKIVTAVRFRANLFKNKKNKIPTGNKQIRNFRIVNGFPVGPSHPKYNTGSKTFNFSIKRFNRAAIRSGKKILRPIKSAGFDKTEQYRYMNFKSGKIGNADYRYIIAPYGSGKQFFVSASIATRTDVRYWGRYLDKKHKIDIFGVRKAEFKPGPGGLSFDYQYNIMTVSIF